MTPASSEPIALKRACVATTVPYGRPTTLAEGELVSIVQTLGESVTVRTELGALLRVNGTDADALGLDDPSPNRAVAASGNFSMGDVTAALQNVYDPEIPVSVVELGLIYRCDEELRPDGTRLISIDMSMTAPGCGMGDVLRQDIEGKLKTLAGVREVDVQVQLDPPWDQTKMSDAARLQLGLM